MDSLSKLSATQEMLIRSPKIEDLNLSFKDYQKIFLQEDSFKKLYAVNSKLQQENQNLLEKLIFMNHLEKFEKDNKVLQAMLKHTEVCEQKAPEVPNFQVIKNIESAYSRKMEEFERSIFGKDKKVAELLFEVAKLKEELHLAGKHMHLF
ncbi:uncharacterized protein LOC129924977 [Biomphalaria glabrata]|uniref:Uncharacterized protein LOC129924977 n=1 Tax=Biomphalaria glabrata TaxID=6526 RepID=A0A9W2ZUK3_BIOGL|nr:uncharacterized protein LOC129924977 [Biomphalaria glabrata]